MGRKSKPGKAKKTKPTRGRKRRLLKRIAFGSVAMVVLSVAMVETTSQNWFCNSCHIMNPFYESWKTDTHADAHCVECHIDPGVDNFLVAKLNGAGQVVDDLLNRTSHKPSASVTAMACMRSGCHSIENLFEQEPQNEVFHFSHEKHVDQEYYGLEMKCTTCHSHVEGSQHFEVDTSVCITCHLIESADDPILAASHRNNGEGQARIIRMAVRESDRRVPIDGSIDGDLPTDHPEEEDGRPPSDCLACHDAPDEEFIYRGLKVNHQDFLAYGAVCESCHRGVTTVPNVIDDASCLACHIFGVDRAQEPEEIHRVHAEGKHKIECFSCHGEPRHGPEAQMEILEEFDCRRCHLNQHNIQRRTYLSADEAAGGVDWSNESTLVSPMFMAHVDCSGCHVVAGPLDDNPHSGAMVRRAAVEGCDGCHAPGLGEKMIPLWQNAARSLYESADEEYRTLDALVTEGEARQLLDEAQNLIELVELDGSWGVHNPRYTQQLLERARAKITAARDAMTPEG